MQYYCYHGYFDDPDELAILEANSAVEAAIRYAKQYDLGDEYDVVFVRASGSSDVDEYKCTYRRIVTVDARLTKTHTESNG